MAMANPTSCEEENIEGVLGKFNIIYSAAERMGLDPFENANTVMAALGFKSIDIYSLELEPSSHQKYIKLENEGKVFRAPFKQYGETIPDLMEVYSLENTN